MNQIFGIIGKDNNTSRINKEWNRFFVQENLAASMHKYPTNYTTLPDRLSEMFYLERVLYFVAEPLQEYIHSLVDVQKAPMCNVVLNIHGVLYGDFYPFDLLNVQKCLDWIFLIYQVQISSHSDTLSL